MAPLILKRVEVFTFDSNRTTPARATEQWRNRASTGRGVQCTTGGRAHREAGRLDDDAVERRAAPEELGEDAYQIAAHLHARSSAE